MCYLHAALMLLNHFKTLLAPKREGKGEKEEEKEEEEEEGNDQKRKKKEIAQGRKKGKWREGVKRQNTP